MKRPRHGRERNTLTSDDSSPAAFQAELDLLDTIAGVAPVIDDYQTGRHGDVEAVRIAGRAICRKAHRAQVARINRRNRRSE